MIGMGTFFWNLNFFIEFVNFSYIDVEFLNWKEKNAPIFLSLLGFIFTIVFINMINTKKEHLYKLFFINFWSWILKINKFFYNGAYFDYFYNEIFIFILLQSYEINAKKIDKGFLELIGPYGIYKLVKNFTIFFYKFYFIYISFLFLFLFLFLFFIMKFLFFNVVFLGILILAIELIIINKKYDY
jgi:hypothetical protein